MSIFDEMMTDDKISQAISIIDSNIINLDWYIECSDDGVRRFLNDALHRMDIRRFISDDLKARQKGFALFEEIWENAGGYNYIKREKFIPQNRVQFEVNELGRYRIRT
jgi:hypothetical protein